MTNLIHIQADWGLFIGKFANNAFHKHYALQVSVTSGEPFLITDKEGKQRTFSSCLLNSNILHRFQSKQPALIILINPISSLGHQLIKKYQQTSIVDLDIEFRELSLLFQAFSQGKIIFTDLVTNLNTLFIDLKCGCEQQNHLEDDRVYKAIQYLESNADHIVSLKEIAAYSFLSETRFLHLFKENTHISFRRYQIWNRLIKSLPFLMTQTISETAHQFGFTDSPHYNKLFKETFGLTPKILSRSK